MIRVAIAVGAMVLAAGVCGAFAAERVIEAGSLVPANNGSAIAAVKAENGSSLGAGAFDAANSQLGSRDDAGALGADKSGVIGSHAYSAAPDAGSIKKGVLNARIEASALATDARIGGPAKLDAGSAAQQVDPRDALK